MKTKSDKRTMLFCKKTLGLFVSLVVVFIPGCANDEYSDLRKYITKINSGPKGVIEPLPEIKVVETFIFKPDGLRDPFRPVERIEEGNDIEIAGGIGVRPDISRHKEELESFSMETLRMVGTMSMNSDLWGLVKVSDGSGTVHHVQVGNYMGKNYGKITRINGNAIELMEIVPVKAKPGQWKEQQASLMLAE